MDADIGTTQLLNRLRMRQVALLLAIEKHRTLRAAAVTLNMTQPAATKMLHELEHTLGQPLFSRAGRGLVMTPAGKCVLGYFRGLQGTVGSLHRELEDLRLGAAGKLLVGSIMAASPAHLTQALIGLKTAYPLLNVEISTNTSDMLIHQLQAGSLDVAIGRMVGLSRRDYHFRPLDDEALSVIVAIDHPLAIEREVSFDDLMGYAWILQPKGSPMRDVMELEFRDRHTAFPSGLIESSSILTTTDLVAKTDMVAVIPHSVAGRFDRHGLLKILPYRIRNTLTAYGSIVRRDRPLTLQAECFLDLLHANTALISDP